MYNKKRGEEEERAVTMIHKKKGLREDQNNPHPLQSDHVEGLGRKLQNVER